MSAKRPQQLPPPTVPWFDPETGQPTPVYYQYMRELDQAVRDLIDTTEDHETRIDVLEP